MRQPQIQGMMGNRGPVSILVYGVPQPKGPQLRAKNELNSKTYAFLAAPFLSIGVNAAPAMSPKQKENGAFSMMLVVKPYAVQYMIQHMKQFQM
jgi:hypothetical protein